MAAAGGGVQPKGPGRCRQAVQKLDESVVSALEPRGWDARHRARSQTWMMQRLVGDKLLVTSAVVWEEC